MSKSKIDEEEIDLDDIHILAELYDIERQFYTGGSVSELGVSVKVTHKDTGREFYNTETAKRKHLTEDAQDLSRSRKIINRILRKNYVDRTTFIVDTVMDTMAEARRTLEDENELKEDFEISMDAVEKVRERN